MFAELDRGAEVSVCGYYWILFSENLGKNKMAAAEAKRSAAAILIV